MAVKKNARKFLQVQQGRVYDLGLFSIVPIDNFGINQELNGNHKWQKDR